MDRNTGTLDPKKYDRVALRKESVDRNRCRRLCAVQLQQSLSARRAWIEIIDDLEPSTTRRVALRKESVDRNSLGAKADSPTEVALRKESVDRNLQESFLSYLSMGRSPQGERG